VFVQITNITLRMSIDLGDKWSNEPWVIKLAKKSNKSPEAELLRVIEELMRKRNISSPGDLAHLAYLVRSLLETNIAIFIDWLKEIATKEKTKDEVENFIFIMMVAPWFFTNDTLSAIFKKLKNQYLTYDDLPPEVRLAIDHGVKESQKHRDTFLRRKKEDVKSLYNNCDKEK
jgi:hypothetical protein